MNKIIKEKQKKKKRKKEKEKKEKGKKKEEETKEENKSGTLYMQFRSEEFSLNFAQILIPSIICFLETENFFYG